VRFSIDQQMRCTSLCACLLLALGAVHAAPQIAASSAAESLSHEEQIAHMMAGAAVGAPRSGNISSEFVDTTANGYSEEPLCVRYTPFGSLKVKN